MATGTVKWFNNRKGWGFIQRNSGGEDLFVHHTAILADGYRDLQQDQIVEFFVTQGPKGPLASEVVVLN